MILNKSLDFINRFLSIIPDHPAAYPLEQSGILIHLNPSAPPLI